MTAFTPSLRQLAYLVELDAQRHFGRAAANLGVGQSTLSAGIAELERLIGIQLVERTKRSVRFTDLGEAFVARARSVVEASVALTEFAVAASAPLTGRLALGVIPTIAPFLLPKLLPPLRERFPALTLTIREQTSAQACAMLHRAALDCVLLALPFECGRIDHAAVLSDPIYLAKPAAATSADAPLLLLEDGHCLNEHGLAGCHLARDNDAPVVATSLHTLIEMVEAGLGQSFVPGTAIDAGMLAGRNVLIEPLRKDARREIALVWRQGSARAADFRLLAKAMIDAIEPTDYSTQLNRLDNQVAKAEAAASDI